MNFRDLHRKGEPFILANAWDRGSAKMLVALGARAIGTSSAAFAFTLGRPDGGTVSRDEALAHAADLAAAVAVPVSGDFENGFGHAPEFCAETVRLAAQAGLCGISIEDAAFPEDRAYPFEEAVERVRAASAAARALPRDFVFVARADGVLNGHYDIDEAIRRVRAFDAAGADCLYVPMPGGVAELRRVIAATAKPVNVLVAGPFAELTRAEFAALGAARLSLGSALARVTHRAIHDAGRAMFDTGDFRPLGTGMPGRDVDRFLG